jgi:membrane-associated phospholipid phosphatase
MDANSRRPTGPGPADTGDLVSFAPRAATEAIREARPARLLLPLIDRRRRIPAIILGGLLLVALFAVPARLHMGEPALLARSVVDDAIPFLDWTIWIYVSYYPFLIAAIWCPREDKPRSDAFYGILLTAAIGLIIFTFWPTAIGRDFTSLAGATGFLWRALFSVDTTANALPSMHVAHTCLAAVALASRGRLWRILAPAWATLIVLSTLTTKQHYAIDVPAGFALAAICFVTVRRSVEYRCIRRSPGSREF